MAYSLNLTQDEVETICFVGGRYCWSERLLFYLNLEATGPEDIPENIAWELQEAFEADMEGGHSPFPMLAPDCTLYRKLSDLWDSIV